MSKETTYTMSKREIIAIFMRWNLDVLTHPEDFHSEPRRDVEASEGQTEHFIFYLEEVQDADDKI